MLGSQSALLLGAASLLFTDVLAECPHLQQASPNGLVPTTDHRPIRLQQRSMTDTDLVRLPPFPQYNVSIILELQRTFPARLGSFQYQLFSCDKYYLYTFVSVEDDNSGPLKSGLRGMFLEDQDTGELDGWVVNGANWTFKSVRIPADLFNPNNAPDLYTWDDNGEWDCYKSTDVFDDVNCSKPVFNEQYGPGKKVRWVGYYSDGNNRFWEMGFSTDGMEGQEDISPTSACGDKIPGEGEDVVATPDKDCLALYLYSAGAVGNLAIGAATSLALSYYALF